MRVGDVLEWIGATVLVAAVYGYGGWRSAAVVAGVFLIYQAQCYARVKVKVKKRKPDKDEKAKR